MRSRPSKQAASGTVPISDSLREELKSPLGELLPEKHTDRETIRKAVAGRYVISVGDRTTEKMISFGLVPSLQIVDNKERRQSRMAPEMDGLSAHLQCKNPAAGITTQSINSIKTAFSLEPPVRITVDGEEDLLVVPACMYAPDNSVVLYGQPGQGLVIVPVTAKIRNKTKYMLELITGV